MGIGRSLALLAAGAAVGATATLVLRRPRAVTEGTAAEPLVAAAADEMPTAEGPRPFEVVDGLIVVRDAQAFLEYVAAALGPKIPEHADAEDVLRHLLGDPPEPGTDGARQWAFMRERIAALLDRPPPDRRLRVVS